LVRGIRSRTRATSANRYASRNVRALRAQGCEQRAWNTQRGPAAALRGACLRKACSIGRDPGVDERPARSSRPKPTHGHGGDTGARHIADVREKPRRLVRRRRRCSDFSITARSPDTSWRSRSTTRSATFGTLRAAKSTASSRRSPSSATRASARPQVATFLRPLWQWIRRRRSPAFRCY